MAAAFGRTRVQIEKTGSSTVVPDNPRAHLMYYFNCILGVIDDGDDDDLDTIAVRRIKDFKNYLRLSSDEIDRLVTTCDKLKPSQLMIKGLLVLKDWPGSTNEFIKIRATRNHLLMTNNVMIGGVRHSVTEQMHCSEGWLDTHYYEPMSFFRLRLNRIRRQQSANRVVLVANDCVMM